MTEKDGGDKESQILHMYSQEKSNRREYCPAKENKHLRHLTFLAGNVPPKQPTHLLVHVKQGEDTLRYLSANAR